MKHLGVRAATWVSVAACVLLACACATTKTADSGSILETATCERMLHDDSWSELLVNDSLGSLHAGADNGVVSCQLMLGRMYEILKRFDEARGLYEAAVGRDARAQLELGRMAEKGVGQPVDAMRARALYGQAADRGNGEAQLALARMHLQGIGGAADPVGAARIYRQAMRRDVHEAWERMDELQMSQGVLDRQQMDEDVEYWRTLVGGRIAARVAKRLGQLGDFPRDRDMSIELALRFTRKRAGIAGLSVSRSSGDPEFDKRVVAAAARTRVPSPPFYGFASDGDFIVRLPLNVQRLVEPGAAPSAPVSRAL